MDKEGSEELELMIRGRGRDRKAIWHGVKPWLFSKEIQYMLMQHHQIAGIGIDYYWDNFHDCGYRRIRIHLGMLLIHIAWWPKHD